MNACWWAQVRSRGALGSWAAEDVFEDTGRDSQVTSKGNVTGSVAAPLLITPLVLAVSYGNSNSLLNRGC